jgi:hypothetical protein
MPFDAKKYADELLQEAGASEEQKQAFLTLVGNEKFAKKLSTDVLMQSDYNRNMDKLANDRKEWEKFYADTLTWRAQAEAELAKVVGNGTNPVNGEVLTKKDLEALEKKYNEELGRREQIQIGLLKDGMRLASQHAVEFKEALDTEALAKIAVDKGITLRAAYDEYVGPRRSERDSESRKNEIKQAREDAVKEYRSQHHLPDPAAEPKSYHAIFDQDRKKQVGADDYVPNSGHLSHSSERALRDSFVDAWNSVPAKGSGT